VSSSPMLSYLRMRGTIRFSRQLSRGLVAIFLMACRHPQPAAPPPAETPFASATATGSIARSTAARVEVKLPGGAFWRGREDGRPDEAPRHRVQVAAFAIDATLVTLAEYTEFARVSGYRTTAEKLGFGLGASEGMDDWAWERIPRASFRRPYWERTPDDANFELPEAPVTMVSYFDAIAYCAYFSKRLPSEAEWEYAMRAGRADSRYPWGDEPTDAQGAFKLNFWQGASHLHNDRLDGFVYVSPVRAYPPNAWGIYDPVGNVWQWTADWYSASTYPDYLHAAERHVEQALPELQSPTGPEQGRERVLRGGSWWCGACTCAGNGLYYRGKTTPDSPFNNNGFRCARSL
jgi:formylglycine-generating enzyme